MCTDQKMFLYVDDDALFVGAFPSVVGVFIYSLQ